MSIQLLRMRIVRSMVTFACLSTALQGQSQWEPFMAKLRRATRTITIDSGRQPVEAVVEETYYRASNGNLRHEVRRVVDGVVADIPHVVELTFFQSGEMYRLHPSKRLAERRNVGISLKTFFEQNDQNTKGRRNSFLGIPCVEKTLRFSYKRNTFLSEGTSCGALGYGIEVFQRGEIPAFGTAPATSWSLDLIEFSHFAEPPEPLVRIPSDYRVVEMAEIVGKCADCVGQGTKP